jgi:uncharacterized protein
MSKPPSLGPDIDNQLAQARAALGAAKERAARGSNSIFGQAVGLAALNAARAATLSLGRFDWKEKAVKAIFDMELSAEAGRDITAIFHELTEARDSGLISEPDWSSDDLDTLLSGGEKFINWAAEFVAARPTPSLEEKPSQHLALTDLSQETQDFLLGLQKAICEREPSSQLILYGSRARQEQTHGSDWDLLVLLDGPVTEARQKAVRVHVYFHSVMLAAAERNASIRSELSWRFVSRQDWNSSPLKDGSFHWKVASEGIEVQRNQAKDEPSGH